MCKCSYIWENKRYLVGIFFDISLLSGYLNYCWMHLHVRKCGQLQEKHKFCHIKLEVLNCSNFLLCKQIKWCKVFKYLLFMRIYVGLNIKLVLNCCLGDYCSIVSKRCLLLDSFIVYVKKINYIHISTSCWCTTKLVSLIPCHILLLRLACP